ncbi:MAG: NUDIX domain-containing protein [Bacteroidia bacterium]
MSEEKQSPNELKVRVYGIIKKEGRILVSIEKYKDMEFAKFPGGGLEFGETPVDCLKRELFEELSVKNPRVSLLHVSEVYVQNRFNPKQQVIGIYYEVELEQPDLDPINKNLNSIKNEGSLLMVRREWIKIKDLRNKLTFEMDLNTVDKIK